MKKHIAVIGGGMAGTAAAHTLLQRGYAVTIIEKDSRLGGRIYSQAIAGLTSETGAGFLTNAYSNTLAFLKEAGLSPKLIERKSGASVVRGGIAHSLANPWTFLGSSWLSLGARLLLVREILRTIPAWRSLDLHDIWKAQRFDTESVAMHLKGKYGQELTDYAIGPAIDSYLYWSPEHTSYPVAMALVKTGSALGQRHTYILRDGLSQIPEAAAKGCKLLLSHTVKTVKRLADGRYKITLQSTAGPGSLYVDGVVCATTASIVPKIIPGLRPAQREFFAAVTYSSTAVATYCLERKGPAHTYAIAYPRREGRAVAAMTVLSDLSPHTDAVKLYASGAFGKQLCSQSVQKIEATLAAAVDLDVHPAQKVGNWRVQKWPEAIPEFDVGHLKRLHAFMNGKIEGQDEYLVFAGDYLGGPFIDGAFTSGIRAANRLDARMQSNL
jgi:oxygen-dependent protoporphyrinogen oxidase